MRNKLIPIISLSFLCVMPPVWAQSEKVTEQTDEQADETTIAASSVDNKELMKRSNINPANALFGKLNGLFIRQNGGYGNGEGNPSMNIRGIGSLVENSILVLVDGLERDINSLVLEEIEDVTILKDAAALAPYGVRGANGVMLVKTKRGKKGKANIHVSYQHSITTPMRLPKMVDAATYAEAVNEGLTNEGLARRYTQQEIDAYRSGKYPTLFPNVNWVKETLRDHGQRDQVNFTASGGSDRIRYYSLLNFISDKGLLKNTDQDSYSTQFGNSILNVRTNLDIDITASTHVKVNLSGKIKEKYEPGVISDEALMGTLYTLPANAFPVKTHNGIWGGSDMYDKNPVAESSSTGYNTSHARTLLADMTLTQDLDAWLPGVSAEFRIGFDAYSETWDTRTKQYLYESNIAHLNNDGVPTDTINTRYGKDEKQLGFDSWLNAQNRHSNIQFALNYQKAFSSGNLLASIRYKQDKNVYLEQYNTYMHQDIVANAHYSLMNKYYFDLNMAVSGTSRLPKNNRWGFFPAISAAWLLNKETFLKETSWLDLLKLRLSYGLTGNDQVWKNMDKYPFGGGGGFIFGDDFISNGGIAEGQLPSLNATFEKSCKANLGIDMRLLNLIDFNLETYFDHRYDIMVPNENVTSGFFGATASNSPNGIVNNYGVEIGMSIGKRIGDFAFNINGQFAFSRNKIIEMNETFKPYDYLKSTGGRLNQFYGLEVIGFFKDQTDIDNSPAQMFSTVYPGDLKYKDQNGDKRIDEQDIIPMGYNTQCPEIFYSVGFDLEYKGFGINAQFQGAGHYTVQRDLSSLYYPLMNNQTISTHYLENCWRPGADNTEATYPRLTTTESANNYRNNSVFMKNVSFLKLRSAEAYYKLPENFIERFRLQEFRLFVKGMDLFSLDNMKETDPEVMWKTYPAQRSVHFGFDLTF